MATGDSDDMLVRLKALLPRGWFGDSTPVLDALGSGFAWGLSFIYGLIQYAQLQTRIATATDGFLDLISFDFFGNNLLRRSTETDDTFRARIQASLFKKKATRQAMIDMLTALTGRAPIIFEPARVLDAGGYDTGILAYDVAGGYGDLNLPAQAFITAFRPPGSGIPLIAGYDTGGGGYDVGRMASISLDEVQGAVTDTDIMSAIDATKAKGTIMWVNLQS